MRKLLSLVILLALTLSVAHAQRGKKYEVKKVAVAAIDTPDFQFQGTQRRTPNRAQWLEIETEFEAEPELTDELTFRYYLLMGGKLYIGDVTHINILKGKERRSVMYVSPNAIARMLDGKNLSSSDVEDAGVEITSQGVVLASKAMKSSKPFWANRPQNPGFLLSKEETPFAPLYWDRYEPIRKATR